MVLKDVVKHLNVISFHGDIHTSIGGIACDSRNITANNIFAAVNGTTFDGHDFLPPAREGGANTVISEQPPSVFPDNDMNWIQVGNVRQAMSRAALEIYGRPDREIPFVGVIGTNGKTTITYLLETVLRQAGYRPVVIGTIAQRFDGTENNARLTTPEAPDVLRYARECIEKGATHLIMEISAHALSFHRVYGFEFHTAIFTNFTQDHLDYYPDMDAYWDAKARLFDGRNGPPPRNLVTNIDDPKGEELARTFPGNIITTGRSERAKYSIIRHEFHPEGTTVTIRHDGTDLDIVSPLIGLGNMQNNVQVFGAGRILGLSTDMIATALEQTPPIPGRMEEVLPGHPFRVIVDYAHSEDALSNACRILRQVTPGKLIVVFGCGGDRDRGKRPKMGKAVAGLADLVIVTSDNPRTEDPQRIIDDIVPGIEEVRSDFYRMVDRRAAIGQAIGYALPGDTVLLAGKGHETGQIIGGKTFPFVDRDIALEFLNQDTGASR